MSQNKNLDDGKGKVSILNAALPVLLFFVLIVVDLPDVISRSTSLVKFLPYVIIGETILIYYLILKNLDYKKRLNNYRKHDSSMNDEYRLILNYLEKEEKLKSGVTSTEAYRALVIKSETGNISFVSQDIQKKLGENLIIVKDLSTRSSALGGLYYKFLLYKNRLYIRLKMKKYI